MAAGFLTLLQDFILDQVDCEAIMQPSFFFDHKRLGWILFKQFQKGTLDPRILV
jgi:hypothetical protein